ncbi:MAG TPA: OmpA family protein [Gemmatimonadales bacterium]|nr:OmpA family protein [Gemmatimonadales bacterium]
MRRSLAGVLTLVTLVPLAASCAMNKAEKGATIGVVGGAAVGAVIGKATGNTVRGAIIGAAVGGIAGGLIGHEMDKQASELAYALPGAVVQRVGEGITVTFPDGLLFGYDSDALTAEARDDLRRFAASMQKYPNTRTLIVGHTDSDGTAAYNMDLSDRRSSSAADFICGEGVNRARVSTAGRGESEPIATNSSDDGRRQNRRIEIAIYANAAAGSSSGN